MQVQVDIELEQLISIVKELPATQWNQLKEAIEKETLESERNEDMETFLLSAPTFTKKQLAAIAKTRQKIDQWRIK